MAARLVSPSCGRNKRPISEVVMERVLAWSGSERRKARVLEFACGTGEHAGYISSVMHADGVLEFWQPTDKDVTPEAAASVAAWSEFEKVPAGVVQPAKELVRIVIRVCMCTDTQKERDDDSLYTSVV